MIPGNANPLLLASAAADAAAAGPIKSLRFNSADSAYLSRADSSSNQKTVTISFWIKKLGTQFEWPVIFSSSADGNNQFTLRWNQDRLQLYVLSGGNYGIQLTPSRKFRDYSGWLHVLVAVDTTASTASDRAKFYFNGVEHTSGFDFTNTYPSQNENLKINVSGQTINIGRRNYDSSQYIDAYLADFYFIDGSALDPTSFGAFDDNGVWQAAAYSGTYGTNGFHLFDFSSESTVGHDSSGNENDFTANNFVAAAGVLVSGGKAEAVSFDGTDDSLNYSSDTDLNPGTGSFTLECFVYRHTGQISVYYGQSSGNMGIRVRSNGALSIERRAVAFDLLGTANDVPQNQWSHIAVTRHAGTIRTYVNGSQKSSASNSQNYTGTFSSGKTPDAFDEGAVASLHFVKGTALYTGSSYTVPTTISSHANTKLLCCQSASSATAATVKPSGVTISTSGSPTAGPFPQTEGKDVDVLFDIPTNGTQSDTGAGGEVSGNYATLNPLSKGSNVTLSNGNLVYTSNDGATHANKYAFSTIAVSSGKWYVEATCDAKGDNFYIGVMGNVSANYTPSSSTSLGFQATGWGYWTDGDIYNNGSVIDSAPAVVGVGDVVGVALDVDNRTVTFYKNGTKQGSTATSLTADATWMFASQAFRDATVTWNFGQRAFAYSAPSNYKALCTTNLPTPTIADGSDYFNTLLWTGDGNTTRSLTGVGFNPDLVWLKSRSVNNDHNLFDVVRGAEKTLLSNSSTSETNQPIHGYVTSFDSDGFSVEGGSSTNGDVNYTSRTYVAWAWDAGSSTVSNTDGSITSSVRANQTAGFSIVTASPGNNAVSIGHGLNAAPSVIMAKSRTVSYDWNVFHASLGGDEIMRLNTTDAKQTVSGYWNNVNSSTFSVASGNNANNSGDMVYYCMAPVSGYSAFGSYTGNSGQNFQHTGFQPRWIMIKTTSITAYPAYTGWAIFDTAREPNNVNVNSLFANNENVEGRRGNNSTASAPDFGIDILSNGFCLRDNGASEINLNGESYIYLAFASHPFSANGGLAR
nr:hypothetical protein [uncultured Mediterranean phage uvMED]